MVVVVGVILLVAVALQAFIGTFSSSEEIELVENGETILREMLGCATRPRLTFTWDNFFAQMKADNELIHIFGRGIRGGEGKKEKERDTRQEMLLRSDGDDDGKKKCLPCRKRAMVGAVGCWSRFEPCRRPGAQPVFHKRLPHYSRAENAADGPVRRLVR